MVILSHPAAGASPRTPASRRPLVALLGPAFVAAIAYVDPGNVAANLTAGADYGYLLVWVLVAANVMAMCVQYLSAKLGLVTGYSLPELLGSRLSRPARLAFWLQAEIVAGATDLAEVIGGAIALRILFDVPLLAGGAIVGIASALLLFLQSRRSQQTFEFVITGLLLVITMGFLAGLTLSPLHWQQAGEGLIPRFQNTETVLLAASMLGATIMPHAIYLHSSLSRDRHGGGRHLSRSTLARLLSATRVDVLVALVVAGSVNIAMVLLAAANLQGVHGIDTIDGAHHAIAQALGPSIGVLFGIGLLASGLASTSVGCYAGSAIMDGLLNVRVPLMLRRFLLLAPVLVILATGFNPTRALVLSQAVLSFGLPCALIPLVRYTNDASLMGQFANNKTLRVGSWLVTALVVALNVLLLILLCAGQG